MSLYFFAELKIKKTVFVFYWCNWDFCFKLTILLHIVNTLEVRDKLKDIFSPDSLGTLVYHNGLNKTREQQHL